VPVEASGRASSGTSTFVTLAEVEPVPCGSTVSTGSTCVLPHLAVALDLDRAVFPREPSR